MKKITITVERRFLNKDVCRAEARRILSEHLLENLSEAQLAREIYFHALAFYFSKNKRWLSRINAHADPIDICDGGDTRIRRTVFSVVWLISGRKGKNGNKNT